MEEVRIGQTAGVLPAIHNGATTDPTPDSTSDDGNPNNDGDGITVLRIQPASSNPQFTLAGLKITGGDANLFAGGILYYGFTGSSITIRDCTITDNSGRLSCGIYT